MNKDIIIIILFITIFFPFFGNLVINGTQDGKYLETENRTSTTFKKLEKFKNKEIKAFFKNIDFYISDRLYAKDTVVSQVSSIIRNKSYFTDADISKVVVGKDGWLFIGDGYEKVVSRHLFPYNVNVNLSYETLKIQTELKKTADEINSFYCIFVIPDKIGIYTQYFPDWLLRDRNDIEKISHVTNRIKKMLEEKNIFVYYPLEYFRNLTKLRELKNKNGKDCINDDYIKELKNKSEIKYLNNKDIINILKKEDHKFQDTFYYKTDTHWNEKGASLGCAFLMDFIQKKTGKSLLLESSYELKRSPNTSIGNLGAVGGVGKKSVVDDIKFELSFDKYKTIRWNFGNGFEEYPVNKKVKTESPSYFAFTHNEFAPNKYRIMIIGDSFLHDLSPFINLNFSDACFISRYNKNISYLTNKMRIFKPDFVIYESLEINFK